MPHFGRALLIAGALGALIATAQVALAAPTIQLTCGHIPHSSIVTVKNVRTDHMSSACSWKCVYHVLIGPQHVNQGMIYVPWNTSKVQQLPVLPSSPLRTITTVISSSGTCAF
jgi:hypothetical protein